MRAFIFHDEKGEIYRYTVCAVPPEDPGAIEIDVDPETPFDLRAHYVSAGQVYERGPQPSEDHRWDWPTLSWVLDLDAVRSELRADLIEKLKRARDTRFEAGFIWDGSPFDSDTAVSQPRLLGLFTTAIAGGIPPEGYAWRLADNTWRVLSASDAIAVWGAFQAHMAGLFAAFAAHEAAVLAETDIEVLRSYDTETGWPA